MRRGWVLGVAILCVAGCHALFNLDPVPTPSTSASCPQLPAGADEDHDGVLNEHDTCPRVANHDPYDEDGDGIADACDPCPSLIEAGEDGDCDGIGAACDPDDASPHEIQFHGFGSALGLSLSGFAIDDGTAHAMPANGEHAVIEGLTTAPPEGAFEAVCTVTGLDVNIEAHVGWELIDPEDNLLRVRITVNRPSPVLGFGFNTTNLETPPISGLQSPARFRMRLSILGDVVRADLSGDLVAAGESTLPAPFVGPVRFIFRAFRGAGAPSLEIRCEYLMRVVAL